MSLDQFPEPLYQIVKKKLSEPIHFQFTSGGCINNGGQLKTKLGDYFVKWNYDEKYPGMFEKEKLGLESLEVLEGVRIPKVIDVGTADELSYLILEYLPKGVRSKSFWIDFGRGLANIHLYSGKSFGLNYDNYIGSLPQVNKPDDSFSRFFIERRLMEQLKLAIDNKRISIDESKVLENSFLNLERHIPESKPSLLHGDLWSGNLIIGPQGEPCLIDPAIYYGHHEIDLAMSQLFGGFDDKYLSAYHEVNPLEKGFEERFDLWNLYPLMVHINLFGGGYYSQVKQILKKYQ